MLNFKLSLSLREAEVPMASEDLRELFPLSRGSHSFRRSVRRPFRRSVRRPFRRSVRRPLRRSVSRSTPALLVRSQRPVMVFRSKPDLPPPLPILHCRSPEARSAAGELPLLQICRHIRVKIRHPWSTTCPNSISAGVHQVLPDLRCANSVALEVLPFKPAVVLVAPPTPAANLRQGTFVFEMGMIRIWDPGIGPASSDGLEGFWVAWSLLSDLKFVVCFCFCFEFLFFVSVFCWYIASGGGSFDKPEYRGLKNLKDAKSSISSSPSNAPKKSKLIWNSLVVCWSVFVFCWYIARGGGSFDKPEYRGLKNLKDAKSSISSSPSNAPKKSNLIWYSLVVCWSLLLGIWFISASRLFGFVSSGCDISCSGVSRLIVHE